MYGGPKPISRLSNAMIEKADRLARDFQGWDALYRPRTWRVRPEKRQDPYHDSRKTKYWAHIDNSDIKDIAEDVASFIKDDLRVNNLKKFPAKKLLKL